MALVIELLANLVDSVVGVLFVLKLAKGTLKGNRTWILFSIFCMAVSTAFLFIDTFSMIHSLLVTMLLYGFLWTLTEKRRLYAVLSPLVFELILILSNTVFVLVFSQFFKIDISTIAVGLTYERVLCILSSKVFLLAVLILTARLATDRTEFYWLDFVLYLLSPATTIVSLYIFILIGMNCDINKYYPLVLVASVGLVIANALTLVFYVQYTKNKGAMYEKEVLACLRESELERYMESLQLYEKIRYMRHDYREQLSYIAKLAQSGENQKLQTHLSGLLANEAVLGSQVGTGNRTVDAILNAKISANPDIVFVISGQMLCLKQLDDIHLVSLLGNMLENAVEETKKHKDKQIEVSFSVVGQYQNITCKNPISSPVLQDNPLLLTTKKNKDAHGYGVKSMKKIVESMNGMIEFYEKENHFYCHAALPIELNIPQM